MPPKSLGNFFGLEQLNEERRWRSVIGLCLSLFSCSMGKEVPERFLGQWGCPSCKVDNGIGMPGRLSRVRQGHGPDAA